MKTKNLIFLFVAVLGICSCSDQEPEALPFELSATILTLPPLDATEVVSVSSGSAWNVYTSASWCSVTPRSGSGNGSFEIKLQDYEDLENRETVLEVRTDKQTQKIRLIQGGNKLTVSPEKINIPANGGKTELKIQTYTYWRIINTDKPDWCQLSLDGGIGDTTLIFTAEPNQTHLQRNFSVKIEYAGDKRITVDIEQAAYSLNTEPTVPEQIFPADGAVGLNRAFSFRWKKSEDVNSDPVKYTVHYSEDGIIWKQMASTDIFHSYPKEQLKANTKYYWKVIADDQHEGIVSSEIRTFTTGTTEAYVDGEVVVYEKNKTTDPVVFVFMGDGFIDEDLVKGGVFDQIMDKGIEALFSVEPYKTYRSYFNIYKVTACSQERGVGTETAFHLRFTGVSIEVTSDIDKVTEYALRVPGLTQANFKDAAVNLAGYYGDDTPPQERYRGGTAYGNIGMETIFHVSDYVNVLVHETGGHAFAELGDEYQLNSTTIPAGMLESLKANGQVPNLEATSDLTKVGWKHFIGLPGYEAVGAYEGGLGYGKGVWHSEKESSMVNDLLYFNAICRELIVKKIKKVAGEAYSFDEFLSKDYVKSPPK